MPGFKIAPWAWAHFVCRVMLGLTFLMAGWFKSFQLTPLGHARRFFTEPYSDTWIPYFLLLAVGISIPVVELLSGVLLIVGWRTREALIAVGAILLVVTYGHLLKEPLFSLTAHILPRTVLLVAVLLIEDDTLSIDRWLRRHPLSFPSQDS
ncbi:MAG: DoxX family protein [Acidobacteriota bacterium]